MGAGMGYLVTGGGITAPVERIEVANEQMVIVAVARHVTAPAHSLGPLRWYGYDGSLILIANVDDELRELNDERLVITQPIDWRETTANGGVWRRRRVGA